MADDTDGDSAMMKQNREVSQQDESDHGSGGSLQTFPEAESPAQATQAHPAETNRAVCVSVRVTLRDPGIQCACPPGTIRRSQEMALVNAQGSLSWIHLTCQPYRKAVIADQTAPMREKLRRAAEKAQDSSISAQEVTKSTLLAGLGPHATESQKVKLNNLTRFICDGPCLTSHDATTYRRCERCLTWQHLPCMLYGDEHDKGGPVCNQCYMNFLLQREEIRAWQKKQLAQAAFEALKFIRDPGTQHETWRMNFAASFLAKFIKQVSGRTAAMKINVLT